MEDLIKLAYKRSDDDFKKEAVKEFKKEISNMTEDDLVGHLQTVRYNIVENKITFLFDFVADKE